MAEDTERSVRVERVGFAQYKAVNVRGGELLFGEGKDGRFTPVELLLTAIAGCSAIDVDYITAKRSEPNEFTVSIRADKIRDDGGNHLTGIAMSFQVRFPEGEAGDAARAVLERAVAQSHDRICTVSRTVELGTPVAVTVD
jgi:putative redox protein